MKFKRNGGGRRLLESEAPVIVKFDFDAPEEGASSLENPVCVQQTAEDPTKFEKCHDITEADITANDSKITCRCAGTATIVDDLDEIYRFKTREDSNSLSTGAVVAIVIVSLIVVALIVVLTITTLTAKKGQHNVEAQNKKVQMEQVKSNPDSEPKIYSSAAQVEGGNNLDVKHNKNVLLLTNENQL